MSLASGHRLFGERLIAAGLLKEEDLQGVLEKQRSLPVDRPVRRIGSLLVEAGLLTLRQVSEALGEQRGVPASSGSSMRVDVPLQSIFPKEALLELQAAPITLMGKTVVVAMVDPHIPANVAALQRLTQYAIKPMQAPQIQVHRLLESIRFSRSAGSTPRPNSTSGLSGASGPRIAAAPATPRLSLESGGRSSSPSNPRLSLASGQRSAESAARLLGVQAQRPGNNPRLGQASIPPPGFASAASARSASGVPGSASAGTPAPANPGRSGSTPSRATPVPTAEPAPPAPSASSAAKSAASASIPRSAQSTRPEGPSKRRFHIDIDAQQTVWIVAVVLLVSAAISAGFWFGFQRANQVVQAGPPPAVAAPPAPRPAPPAPPPPRAVPKAEESAESVVPVEPQAE